jgi:glycosyltransferase involved in cell wall biosynthesis
MTHHFNQVTLLVTHYNRSQSLKRLLSSFRDLALSFGDIVVSDDGSKPEHVNELIAFQHEIPFRLVLAERNGGLGNNINKGQAAVTTPYTLYVQEDFVPTEHFEASFRDALSFMQEDKNLDYIRFYAYVKYPYLQAYAKGFSKLVYHSWQPDYRKIYAYSDHPHLRRSDFISKFGTYKEGVNVDRSEYAMCISFIQKGGNGLFFDKYQDLFIQKNSSGEPSTMNRNNWKEKNNIFTRVLRRLYRTVKYNYDIHFMRT